MHFSEVLGNVNIKLQTEKIVSRKIFTILLLIAISAASTLYAVFLSLSFHSTVVNGTNTMPGAITMALREPYFLVPLSIGIIGWISTVYEVITLKQQEFPVALRKRMSREGYDRSVYRIFTNRGGARRIAIMNALDTPKLRNEIANTTNTDWKEVDRNLKILESVNLVKIQFSHGSLSVYRLTESGKELMNIIHSQGQNTNSKAISVHS